MDHGRVVIGWHSLLARKPTIESCRWDVKQRLKRIHIRRRKRGYMAIHESAEDKVELAHAAVPRLIAQAFLSDLKRFLNGLIEAHTLTFDFAAL